MSLRLDRAHPVPDERMEGPAHLAPPIRWARIGSGVALVVVVSASLFDGLGLWPLMEPDEGRNAETAREMLASGDWLVPHFNGLPFLDKPVGLFWMIAGAFRVFGVNEGAARLPSALAAVSLVMLTFAIGRMLLGTRRGFLAATIVATSPLVLIFGRLAIFDMPFSALAIMALWSLLQARLVGPPAVWLPVAGLVMGLATLTKGPVGIAVPLLAWFAGRGALPPPRERAGWRTLLTAVLAFSCVVLPWAVIVAGREPEFLRYALLDETVLRFTSTARVHRGAPFYYHVVVLALGLGVWTAVLIGASPLLIRRSRGRAHDASGIRFAARASGAILLFFSLCASKRPGYIIPAIVPLGILIAAGTHANPRQAATAVLVVALLAIASGLFIGAVALPRVDAWRGMLSLDASPALREDVLLAGAVVLVGWGAAVTCSGRSWPSLTLALGALLVPGLYLALLTPLMPYAEQRSARTIARHVRDGVPLIAFRTFRTGLPFYLRQPVVLATTTGRELTSNYVIAQLDRFLDHGTLVRPRHLWEQMDRGVPLYILTTQHKASLVAGRSSSGLEAVWSDRRRVLLVQAARSGAHGASFAPGFRP